MYEAPFFMPFPLFAVMTVILKINLKTSIGGVILAKRRIELNETAYQSQRNGVSLYTSINASCT